MILHQCLRLSEDHSILKATHLRYSFLPTVETFTAFTTHFTSMLLIYQRHFETSRNVKKGSSFCVATPKKVQVSSLLIPYTHLSPQRTAKGHPYTCSLWLALSSYPGYGKDSFLGQP